MNNPPDLTSALGHGDEPPAIDVLVTFPGAPPNSRHLMLVPLGDQRYRVAFPPLPDTFEIECGDEIELTHTATGGHTFRAVVEKSPLRIETFVLSADASGHAAFHYLMKCIQSEGGTATLQDGQLVTQLRRSSKIDPADTLRAGGLRVHAAGNGLCVPRIFPGDEPQKAADKLREAAALAAQQSNVARRGLRIDLADALREASSALAACVPVLRAQEAPPDASERRKRVADLVDLAIMRIMVLEQLLKREMFPGYRAALRRALAVHPETRREAAALDHGDSIAAARRAWDLASTGLPLDACTYVSYYGLAGPPVPGLRLPERRPRSARWVARVEWNDLDRFPAHYEELFLSLDRSRNFWVLWSEWYLIDYEGQTFPPRAIIPRAAADARTCLQALLVTAFRGAWEFYTPPWDELKAGELLSHAEITQLAALMWRI